MTFGAEIWGPALISAAGSIGGGYLSGRGGNQQETKIQRQQRKLIDQLISGLGGEGTFSNLFNSDENAFQKSFVEPAQSLFKNQIAPQIQQQYIASGQQRNSGLEDQLLRAGVDLDQLLNQHMFQFQESNKNRAQNSINSILGAGAGAMPGMSSGQMLAQSTGGYLGSPAFGDAVSGLFKSGQPQQPQSAQKEGIGNVFNQMPQYFPPRKGYEQ